MGSKYDDFWTGQLPLIRAQVLLAAAGDPAMVSVPDLIRLGARQSWYGIAEVGLAPILGIRTCTELFHDSQRELLHTTSAARYPVFVRKRDGSLTNYSGTSPGLTTHPWLRDMIQSTLASEPPRHRPHLSQPR